jgi:alpha-1,6-mannosyltransferase
MVGRWQGAASRSLVMHADPLAAYAYRWLGGVVSIDRIDLMFGWFWRHLRGLGRMFDSVICANDHLATRLRDGGLANAQTMPMGVEAGLFSSSRRSEGLREAALRALGLDTDATFLLGVGRFSAEKRWNMVLRAVGEVSRRRPVGMLLVGDGSKRFGLELLANRTGPVALLPPITDREELARLMASADALVHGCEAETFCMVAAEARASGIPLIVPDRGAAMDQLVSGAGTVFRSGSQISLERAIGRFLDHGPELQRAAAARVSWVRTMDEHFADLFAHYEALVSQHALQPSARLTVGDSAAELALARSAMIGG